MNDQKILEKGYIVYTDIFKYKLSSAAFLIYFYFSNYFNMNETTKISYEEIAKRCNIASKTVFTAINELTSCNLMVKETLFNKNEYHLTNIKSDYFILKENICPFELSKTELYIYCAIISKTPSPVAYSELASITNLSRATAINKIKALQDKELIAIEKIYDSNMVCLSNKYIVL